MKSGFPFILIFILLSSFGSSGLVAQKIYFQTNRGEIYEYLSNGFIIHHVNVVNADGGQASLLDIAISPTGDLFGVTMSKALVKIDWNTGRYEFITKPNTINSKSLVCSGENRFIFLEPHRALKEIDISTQKLTTLVELDETTPGDIALCSGNIIFPTYEKMIAYNVKSDSLYDIYCFDQPRNDFGMVKAFSGCQSSIFYFRAGGRSSDKIIYSVDVDTKTSELLPKRQHLNGWVFGMASEDEHLGLLCPSRIIDNVDCIVSGNDDNLIQIEQEVYPNPAIDIIIVDEALNDKVIIIQDNYGHVFNRFIKNNLVDISDLPNGTYHLSYIDKFESLKYIQSIVVSK